MRRLLCAFLAFIFCTVALSAECPIGTTPAQYIQLEYIESTGTQYIDTGVLAESGKSWEIEFSFSSLVNNGFIGARVSNFRFWFILYSSYFDLGLGDDRYISSVPIVAGNRYKNTLVTDNNGWVSYINDIEVAKGNDVATKETIKGSIYLFKINNVSGSGYSGNSRIYYTKIWDGDALIYDFIPVLRLNGGKPGMYDKVSGRFFTNQGTGEFIAGPEVSTEFMNFNKCNPCPPNTYKDFVGNGECTPCPDALISPSGSKSVSECGRVLHIGDKIYHMKSVKQTSPALHIRDENGNVWYGNLYSE